MIKGIPETLAASSVRDVKSLRSIYFKANFRAPAMNCCSPWVRRLI